MPYRIYETQAFILSSRTQGEADRVFTLYTREFGLVRATAQGIRELKSKLRYSLQPYAQVVVNMVRGRGGWRITNARLAEDTVAPILKTPGHRLILVRVLSLVRRMLAGEERNTELFDSLSNGSAFLSGVPNASLPEAEILLVLRVLYHLGYVGASAVFSELMVGNLWNDEALHEASRCRKVLVNLVNESLRSSHL